MAQEPAKALVPGTIEPRRAFLDQEVEALTAYLMTFKQGQARRSKLMATTTPGGPR